jgi:molybdate transport system permease protein
MRCASAPSPARSPSPSPSWSVRRSRTSSHATSSPARCSSTCCSTCRSCCRRRSPASRCFVTLGRRGVIGEQLDAAGLDVAFTTTAVILAQLFVSAPFYIRTAKAGFESIEPVYEGVALDARRIAAADVLRVTLPLAWPSLLAGAVLCWARALSELGATLIFAGSLQGKTQTMPLAIISSFESGQSIDVPIALSVILVAAAAVLLLLLRVLARGASARV